MLFLTDVNNMVKRAENQIFLKTDEILKRVEKKKQSEPSTFLEIRRKNQKLKKIYRFL